MTVQKNKEATYREAEQSTSRHIHGEGGTMDDALTNLCEEIRGRVLCLDTPGARVNRRDKIEVPQDLVYEPV